jgi:hypothetical protein
MVARAVAWFPGDQDEFFVGRLLSQSGRLENQRSRDGTQEQITESGEFHRFKMHHVSTLRATAKLQS